MSDEERSALRQWACENLGPHDNKEGEDFWCPVCGEQSLYFLSYCSLSCTNRYSIGIGCPIDDADLEELKEYLDGGFFAHMWPELKERIQKAALKHPKKNRIEEVIKELDDLTKKGSREADVTERIEVRRRQVAELIILNDAWLDNLKEKDETEAD